MAPTVLTLPSEVRPFPGNPGDTFGDFTVPYIPLPGNPDYANESVTDALFWLFTRTAFDGVTTTSGLGSAYAALSGPSFADRTIFQFPADATTIVEGGLIIGSPQADNSQPNAAPGFYYPQYGAHAWRHIEIDGQGGILWQQDPTNYDSGLRDKHANTTAGSTTVTLQGTLSVDDYNWWLESGSATIQSTITTTTGKLFSGNVRGTAILNIAADRQTITVGAGTVLRDSTLNESVVVYLAAVHPERQDGVQVAKVDAPGAWLGVERAAMNVDITFSNWRIRGSNSAGADGVAAVREGWHGIYTRRTDGITFQDCVIEKVYGDGINTGTTSQVNAANAGVQVEHLTVVRCGFNQIGRHWLTLQGALGIDVNRCVARDVDHLAIDNEATTDSYRITGQITNSMLSGTALHHASPAIENGEPPRTVDGLHTVSGSNVVTMPSDLITNDDQLALITHPNLPAGTYMYRRLSLTQIEVNQNATLTGTADGTIGGAVAIRDWTLSKIQMLNGAGNFAGNASCPLGRAYFTFDVTSGDHQITNIEWESRLDDFVPSMSDIVDGDTQVYWGQNQLFPGSKATVQSHTSTTITFGSSIVATASSVADSTFTATTVKDSRTITATTNVFVNKDDKNHSLSGPAGLLRPGTVIDSASSTAGKNATLSQPALASGTGTFTEGGKVRGWVNIVPALWTGLTLEEIRSAPGAAWGGTGVIANPANQPLLQVFNRTDDVTVRKNYLTGALSQPGDVVARYMVGAFTNPGVTYTVPDGLTWTVENNRGVNMVDDQVGTPSVTVGLVLTVDDASSDSPVFTVVATRSDAASEDGSGVLIYRDGQRLAGCILDGDTGTYRYTDFSDALGNGEFAFTAEWAGSWDTLSSTSNTVTVNPGAVTPTATTLTLSADPVSPSDEGTTVTLTASVSPDPGAELVTFTDDGVTVGTATLTSSTGSVTTTFPAGTHTVVASWAGNSLYLADSDTLTYTADAVTPSDTTPPEVASVDPPDGDTDVDRQPTITVTFSEAVTGPAISVRTDETPFRTLPAVVAQADVDGLVWTVTLADLLAEGRRFFVVVDDATDLAGNHLTGRFSSSFTTGYEALVIYPVLVTV